MQSRYYDSNTGRFINADDAAILKISNGDLIVDNLFAYGCNNPLSNKDYSGRGSNVCKNPKYNKLYKMSQSDKNNTRNFNCYAYAIGKRSWCIPGRISGSKNQYGYAQVYRQGDSVEKLLRYTISDLTKLNYHVKEVSKSYKPKNNQTMIAMRTCSYDFHYMRRMKNGKWTHKPGSSYILQLNKNPWDYKKWHIEAYFPGVGWYRSNDFAYDSKIKYVVYWR